MSDRIKGVVVTFDKDYKDEDAQKIIDAIYMIKCVLSVDPQVAGAGDFITRTQVKSDLEQKLWSVLRYQGKAGDL